MRPPEPPDGLRERVLARTLPYVRRRAGRRRALVAVGVVAAYAGGLATAALFAPEAARPAPESVPVAAAPAPTASPTPAAVAQEPLLPDELLLDPERFALLLQESKPERRGELLRQAGDRWLDVHGDYERAVNCYRQFLDLAPPKGVSDLQPQDNWLLRSLKLARLQENRHENASI